MLMIPNACDSRGLASTSTLTTSTTPSYLAASFSIPGATILHGPHQVAQKSTTTGLSLLSTSASNVSSVAALISATGRLLSPAEPAGPPSPISGRAIEVAGMPAGSADPRGGRRPWWRPDGP